MWMLLGRASESSPGPFLLSGGMVTTAIRLERRFDVGQPNSQHARTERVRA